MHFPFIFALIYFQFSVSIVPSPTNSNFDRHKLQSNPQNTVNSTFPPTSKNKINQTSIKSAEQIKNSETDTIIQDPTESTQPTQLIEPSETTEITETNQTTESIEPSETTEITETNQTTESIEPTEPTETTESTESIEPTESIETTESTESIEPTQTMQPTETSDSSSSNKIALIVGILVGAIALIVIIIVIIKFLRRKRTQDLLREKLLAQECFIYSNEKNLYD